VEPLASMRGVTKFIYGSDGRPLRNTEVKILDGVDFDVFPARCTCWLARMAPAKAP